jgi:ketohexokinase
MSSILIVGNAVLDLILGIGHFPMADEEMRASFRRLELGGNGANTARVLAGLGHRVDLLATLGSDADASRLRELMEEAGLDTRHLVSRARGQTPLSYILLDESSASRTIVHHRALGELGLDDFQGLPHDDYAWIHFEGRNVDQVRRMMAHLAATGFAGRISVEIEKDRPGIEALTEPSDLALFSRAWAQARGYADAPALLVAERSRAARALLSCTWGKRGAWAMEPTGEIHHRPAFAPPRVVDTVGAGDAFNAGMIDALLDDASAQDALYRATRLAGHKIGQQGFAGLGRGT